MNRKSARWAELTGLSVPSGTSLPSVIILICNQSPPILLDSIRRCAFMCLPVTKLIEIGKWFTNYHEELTQHKARACISKKLSLSLARKSLLVTNLGRVYHLLYKTSGTCTVFLNWRPLKKALNDKSL